MIGSRFHYKIKRHSAGSQKLKVKRLKVRLVVQGQHMSKEKGDFVNAFSPVPHASGVRTMADKEILVGQDQTPSHPIELVASVRVETLHPPVPAR